MAVLRLARVAVLLLFGIQGAAALAQGTVLEVIPLRYRQAAEVIPIIQPMLGREGSVSGYQGQLVVRTTPANLAEVKRLLAALDTAPRQLLITVREEGAGARSRSEADIAIDVGGEHGRVVVPPPASRDPRGGSVTVGGGDDRVRLRGLEESGAQEERGTQTVRVMEGREAFVRAAQSAPVRERQVQRTVVGGKVVERVVESTQYRDAASGFYVLPRLAGDRVMLDISQQREALRGASGAASVQSVVTTVSGRMGEWIEIGGVDQETGSRQSALLGRSSATARDGRRILIKVEEVR